MVAQGERLDACLRRYYHPLRPRDLLRRTEASMRRLVAPLVPFGIALTVTAAIPLALSAQTPRTPTPGKAAWSAPLTVDGQPDLQGVWSDLSMTPLERPKALAGRAVLTDEEVARLRERAERLLNDDANDFVAGDNFYLVLLSDLEKIRNPNATGRAEDMVKREFDNRTSLITDPKDGRLPPMTPDGLKRQAAAQAATLAVPWVPGADGTREPQAAPARRLPAGPEDLSNALRCISWGVPRIAGNANYNSHYQIFQGPGYVVLLSAVNHEARVIPLDRGPHLPDRLRQVTGDSRGYWEGNTLVVDTTNFSPRSAFMGSAAGLHLTARFTRVSQSTITYEITVDDPTTWVRPWTAVIRLHQAQDSMYEFACHEGNLEVMRGILGGARAEEKEDR